MSPSASVSPSPSAFITGITDDIIAIRQVDDLTVIETPATNIIIYKSLDSITVKDIEDVLAGTSSLEVAITAHKQADDIRIVKPVADSLTIKS